MGISINRYWENNWNGDTINGTEDEIEEQFSSILEEVIHDHLVSDVPVGGFLSGGIDSSLVASRASQQVGSSLETFTVSFPEQSYDESPLAGLVANHVGVRHTITSMESMRIDESICRFVLPQVGQPFADTSCLPTYLVS